MSNYKVIGVMSGTSLDGLDLAYCEFSERDGRWSFEIKQAETIPYSTEWKERLQSATGLSGLELSLLSTDYGHYTGKCIKEFIHKHNLQPDFAAVHGHTVFHQPTRGLTLQIGNGAAVAAESGLMTVCDFRTTDVALGGQGAPLVPIGDRLLFSKYDYCLNLGGIANISYEAPIPAKVSKEISKNSYMQGMCNFTIPELSYDNEDIGKLCKTQQMAVFRGFHRTAFDICPCNMPLNYLANLAGIDFDKDGELARKGSLQEDLLTKLNALNYYQQAPPKSLGVEWFEKYFKPLLKTEYSTNDLLKTVCEHIAIQISQVIDQTIDSVPQKSLLITGGGALNTYLIERITAHTKAIVTQASKELINYKEALIFAFLGVLRVQQKPNALASVTGAAKDNCGGAIYLP
ncbi:MAG: anhydro-N-acetylmuramic acid kinase [Bacteroidales bacterium]|jgi:anhydro-N-acetylmuramic acid kinase|nr:anhydro-N-acetylmuramic acid kinase [Bacteroidales bacterium]